MQHKKGQAAMEFLMTYGWAILAAIVAIGVLAYFGVFSPGKLAGNTAIVNNPFYASSWQISATGPNVKLELVNNGGDTIIVDGITVTGTGSSVGVDCTKVYSTAMSPGVQTLFGDIGPCVGTVTLGNNYAGNINILYHRQGSALNQTATGSIRATIAA